MDKRVLLRRKLIDSGVAIQGHMVSVASLREVLPLTWQDPVWQSVSDDNAVLPDYVLDSFNSLKGGIVNIQSTSIAEVMDRYRLLQNGHPLNIVLTIFIMNKKDNPRNAAMGYQVFVNGELKAQKEGYRDEFSVKRDAEEAAQGLLSNKAYSV